MKYTAQDFLDTLSESIGVPLAYREDLTCCLSTPDGLEIQIEWAPEHKAIVFLSPLGQLPAGCGEQRCRELLTANFLFRGTRGETISLEDSTDRIMLCQQFDPEKTTTADAVDTFRRFADTASQWRNHLLHNGVYDQPNLADTPGMLRA